MSPASPESAPEMTIASTAFFWTLMPPYSAAKRLKPDRFHLIAEHRPVEDEDDQRGGDDRDEDAEVEVGALGQQGDRLGFQRSGRPG